MTATVTSEPRATSAEETPTDRTDLVIRPAEAADLPAILTLLDTSMGEHSLSSRPDYWRWKHVDNPFGESPCLVACAAGQIVGLRVFMRWRWQTGDRSVDAVRAVDTATHPEWRRRGIFSTLTKALVESCRNEGVRFIFNTPNPRSRAGYLKMGWEEVARLPAFVRPLRPARLLTALGRNRGPGASVPAVAEIDGATPAREFLASSAAGFLPELARADEPRYHTVRSREYLSWRYAAIPAVDYYAVWSETGAPAAVIFGVKERRGLREVRVNEILVSPGTAGTRQAGRLLRALSRACRADYVVATGASGSQERAALLRALFVPVRGVGPILCARPLSATGSYPDPLRWRNWKCGIGELELF